MQSESPLLRRTLQANGLFSIASGLALVAFGGSLTALMGLGHPIWLWALAPGLLVFGALVLALGRRPAVPAKLAWMVTGLDWGWVAGSGVLLAFAGGHLSGPGMWLVADVALVVATFAVLQQVGLRRGLHRETGADRPRVDAATGR